MTSALIAAAVTADTEDELELGDLHAEPAHGATRVTPDIASRVESVMHEASD